MKAEYRVQSEKKKQSGNDFLIELQKHLEENRKLYRDSSFLVPDNKVARFVAARLGVNPWKVMVPAAVLISLVLRVILGPGFSEIVLRVLGG